MTVEKPPQAKRTDAAHDVEDAHAASLRAMEYLQRGAVQSRAAILKAFEALKEAQ